MKQSDSYALNRIEAVISYIDNNLDQPLSLHDLASMSCWSRWQLQRVFQNFTGVSVAQYVREQKLSRAAEHVLSGQTKMVEIAYQFGFGSEVAFSRAFSTYFGLSPKKYQKRGTRDGIKAPCVRPAYANYIDSDSVKGFFQVRIEHAASFSVFGVNQKVMGVMAANPDYAESVPNAWETYKQAIGDNTKDIQTWIGVIDLEPNGSDTLGELNYLAGSELVHSDLECVEVPENDFAVLPYSGEIQHFAQAVAWLVIHWLPSSGYIAVDGPELEIYRGESDSKEFVAEYWLPIRKA